MEASDFDEIDFFRAIARSGAHSLLIGRRALVLLGLPVLTADYDFWIDVDHITRFNAAAAPFGLQPTRSPEDARRMGRYVLENGEHVDVLVARSAITVDGVTVRFDTLWETRRSLPLAGDVSIEMPDVAGLILTKRIAARLDAILLERCERTVTAEEARSYLETPVSERERADILSLVNWFRRRYPNPAERLAYVRRAYARWLRLRARLETRS